MLTVAPHGPDFDTPDDEEELAADQMARQHRIILAYLKVLSPIIAALVASIGTMVGVMAR